MDKDQVSGLVFVGYKNTFDLIDHDILLSKFEAYKLLKGRRSSVVIDRVHSEYR